MAEETQGGIAKKFLYVNRKAPYVGDGVFQLTKGQDTKGLEMKNFSPAFRALEDYDVTKLYVEEEALQARGLTAADLAVPVEVVSAQRLAEIMEDQDVILSF
jgi:tRNA 2-thiouridine synthesizing protein C